MNQPTQFHLYGVSKMKFPIFLNSTRSSYIFYEYFYNEYSENYLNITKFYTEINIKPVAILIDAIGTVELRLHVVATAIGFSSSKNFVYRKKVLTESQVNQYIKEMKIAKIVNDFLDNEKTKKLMEIKTMYNVRYSTDIDIEDIEQFLLSNDIDI